MGGGEFSSVPRYVEDYRILVTLWSLPPTTITPERNGKVPLPRPPKTRAGEARGSGNRHTTLKEPASQQLCGVSAVNISQSGFLLYEIPEYQVPSRGW